MKGRASCGVRRATTVLKWTRLRKLWMYPQPREWSARDRTTHDPRRTTHHP